MNSAVEEESDRITAEDASSVLNFTRSLMRTESISGKESPVGNKLSLWLESVGWHVTKQAVSDPENPEQSTFNILATRNAFSIGDKGPRILFNSHIDVVPPQLNPTMSSDGKVGMVQI